MKKVASKSELRLEKRKVDPWLKQRGERAFGVSAELLEDLPEKVHDLWVEMPIDHQGDAWLAAARLVLQGDRYAIGELRFFPREPGDRRIYGVPGRWSAELVGSKAIAPRGGITWNVIHKLQINEPGRSLAEAERYVAKRYGAAAFEPRSRLAEAGLRPPIEKRPRARRETGKPDEYYARLAADYVDAVARDPRPRPLIRLADARKLDRDKVRDQVHEAVNRGLLSPGAPGKTSGRVLTALGRAVLDRAAGARKGKVHR